MHIRSYGHHGYGAKLFEGDKTPEEIAKFFSHFKNPNWTQDNCYPLIGVLDGIELHPHIYSQYSIRKKRGKDTIKLMGRFINWRASTGSCTEVEFDSELDALVIWCMIFPDHVFKVDNNYTFGKSIGGVEVGFELYGKLYPMPKWDINLIKIGRGYSRQYIADPIIES